MSAINTSQLINAVTEFHSQRAKSSQTPNWFSLISSKIKIITVFQIHQEQWKIQRNPSYSRIKIKSNWSNFFVVLRDSMVNLHHWTTSSAILAPIHQRRTGTITEDWEKWEEEDRSGITSVKKKKRITDLFSVQELTRSIRKDLFVRISDQNQVIIKTSSFFIAKAQRRATNVNKWWIEAETLKRFEKDWNRNPKNVIHGDSPFICEI
jgi:glucan phosphorylase